MKIPKARKLKSGTWFIQLRLGGESISITASTESECKKQATLIKAEYSMGQRQNVPVDVALKTAIERYIQKMTPVLSPSTIRGYRVIQRTRFQKYMPQSIQSIQWQEMINAEIPIASAKTIKNAWALVQRAVTQQGIALSQKDVTLPQVPVKEIPYLRPDEIIPFCRALQGSKIEIGALLELHGLRISELMALTWEESIDLKRGLIRVNGALVLDENANWIKKTTTKNTSSTRTVPIMIPRLAEVLKAVPNKKGAVVTVGQNTMLTYVNKACEAAGVTVVGNHGLRHSFASLGYHVGLTERQLMDLGGWADINTMHKIYIRLSQADTKAAQNAMTTFYQTQNAN